MALLMVLTVVYSASGSFLRDRQNGALELILVTPISTARIICGRLLGIWGMFLLPITIVIGSFAYYLSFNIRRVWISDPPLIHNVDTAFMFFLFPWLTVSFAVIGLHFSLTRNTFVSALVSSLLFGAIMPIAGLATYEVLMVKFDAPRLQLRQMITLGLDFAGLQRIISPQAAFMPFLAVIQFPIALWASRRLARNLRDRRFA